MLVIKYMINDADGYTSEHLIFTSDAPTDKIERLVTLVNKILNAGGTPGHIGFMFDTTHVNILLSNNIISVDEHEFLRNVIDLYDDFEYFEDVIRSEAEYGFLLVDSIYILYYDEDGLQYKTVIQ